MNEKLRAGAAALSADLLDAPDVRTLSAEEAEEVKRSEAAMDELLVQDGRAKYKLEIMFNHERSIRNLTPGFISFWESGNKLHGGGDSKVYLCENSVKGSAYEGKGCGGFIPDSCNGLNFVVCPHCQLKWDPQYMVGEVFYRLPLQKWAEVIARWHIRMQGHADITLKYAKMSVRDAQRKESLKGLRGELLEKVRDASQRPVLTYPLKNIIRDTSNGADLTGRIYSMLTA